MFGDKVVHLVIDGASGRDISETFGLPRQQEVVYLPNTKIEIRKVKIANDGNPLIFAREVASNENIRTKETGSTGNNRPTESLHQNLYGQRTVPVRNGRNYNGVSGEIRSGNGGNVLLSQWGKGIETRNVLGRNRSENGIAEEVAKTVRNKAFASRSGMAAQSILNKIKAGETPADSEINELVYVAINDRALVERAIDHGMAQNNDSQAFAVASRLEKKLAKNRSVSAKEFKELILSELSNDTSDSQAEPQYSIQRNSKGFYVKADRKVIQGEDPNEWAKQIEEYINNSIRNNRDVLVRGMDGDPLTITSDTAGKASYRNEVVRADQTKRYLTDDEYAAKLRAESHIDELAKVSKNKDGPKPDTKDHPFAKDGFNYRNAYFEDIDGTQYLVTISVGRNGRINTVYNVGKMETKKVKQQQSVAQRPSGAKTATANFTNKSISQENTFVNSNYTQKSENDTKYTEEKRIKFESTARNVSSLKDGYGSYTKEQVRSFRRVADAFVPG